MIPWLRKNHFIKDLREQLHKFKIVEISTEISDEARFLDGGVHHTGRQVITIRLTGYWKGESVAEIREVK